MEIRDYLKEITLATADYKVRKLKITMEKELDYRGFSCVAKLIYNKLKALPLRVKDFKYYLEYRENRVTLIRLSRSEFASFKERNCIWQFEDGVKEHQLLWNMPNKMFKHFVFEAQEAKVGPAKLITVLLGCSYDLDKLVQIFEIGPKTLKYIKETK